MSAPILHLSIWQRPVFLLNSCLGLFTAAHKCEHPLSRSYGVNLPSSLTTFLPLALESSSYLPVSVCGTGTYLIYTELFSPPSKNTSLLIFGPLRPGQPTPGIFPSRVSLCLNGKWSRNINRVCIDYAFRPHLSSRLTWSGRTFLKKP